MNEWYPHSEKTITLDAGQKETVSYTGHPYLSDEGDPDINNVQFNLKSINNSNINKTYNLLLKRRYHVYNKKFTS